MDKNSQLDKKVDSVGILQRYYQCFNAQDWEGMLSLLTDDVVHDINQGKSECGRDTFRAFLGRMNRSYKETIKDIVIMADSTGKRAATEYVVDGIYHHTDTGLPEASNQHYVLPGGAFFELRGSLIARVTNYYNLETWLNLVGKAD